MAALGIPALISGVLHTTGATNKLQKVEQEKVAILRSMGDQAGVSIDRVNSFTPLEGTGGGKPDGHQLVNRSAADVVYLEIGDRLPGDEADYPDIDMKLRLIDGKPAFLHKDGKPY